MTEKIIFSNDSYRYKTNDNEQNEFNISCAMNYIKNTAKCRLFVPVAQLMDYLEIQIDDIRYYKIGWKNPEDVRYEYTYHFENETYWIMLAGLVEI